MSNRLLAIDLFCGLGGWTEGLIAEGYHVIGFDIERHDYGDGAKYPAQLVIQDVLTLHGSQFKDAALIVASPPCQAYSYRAMPWKRAKALPPPDNTLFDACFRIQREAIDAAGHYIPMVVENVRGAQKWVGRARWNYGSYYLWGDVPALMPIARRVAKVPMPIGGDSFKVGFQEQSPQGRIGSDRKNPASAGAPYRQSLSPHGHRWMKSRQHIFKRAVAELVLCGIYLRGKPTFTSICNGIRSARGMPSSADNVIVGTSIEFIETWLAERKKEPPLVEAWDSWKSRPEWAPSKEMRRALDRATAETVRGRSLV